MLQSEPVTVWKEEMAPFAPRALEDWEHHIARSDGETAYCCDKNIKHEFHYLNLEHAIDSLAREDRIQPCPACYLAAKSAFAGMGGVSDWLRISGVSGYDEGWIRPEMVVRVGPNPGQHTVLWKDETGKLRLAQRAYGEDDDKFMIALGLLAPQQTQSRSDCVEAGR